MNRIRELRQACGDGTDEDQLVHATGTRSVEQARAYLHQIILQLLNGEQYGAAGYLLWGPLFNPEPKSVRDIFRCIRDNAKLIILGCSSVSKTYSGIAWMLMDWLRDPEYTGVKVISTTAGHAEENVFSTLHTLHGASIIPLPGDPKSGFIGTDPRNMHAGLALKSIPPGEDGKGALQGFHPQPRKKLHPLFGWSSRVRVYLDEAEEIPGGVWVGVKNLLSNLNGTETIKVVGTTNPRNVTSMLARNAEPDTGWARLAVDRDFEWESRQRYHVLRIDGYETENVQQGKIIYPGFLTLEGYRDYQLDGGENSSDYWTFGRGMYPLAGAGQELISVKLLDLSRGEFVFNHTVVDVASEDLAFEGDNLAKLALLRYGEAIGFKPLGVDKVDLFDQPRWTVQLDQILNLPKLRTEAQYEQSRLFVEEAGVEPEWYALDRTGNATGVYDLMVSRWSSAVMGIHWGEAATEKRIMEESQDLANEICEGVVTEMHWALRLWIEFGYFAIGPHVDTRELFSQLSSRKIKSIGKTKQGKQQMRLQSKKEFKAKFGRSPDDGDVVAMGLHICRMNGQEKAAMSRHRRKKLLPRETIRKGDVVEFHNWVED